MKVPAMQRRTLWLAVVAVFVLALGIAGALFTRDMRQEHHVVFQLNSSDIEPAKHAISNAVNLIRHYRENGQTITVEFIGYGPGVNIFRTDASPLIEVLTYIRTNFPEVSFTICGNTKSIIEQREGHSMPLIAGTGIVPSGIVRIIELQEAGWTYIRP